MCADIEMFRFQVKYDVLKLQISKNGPAAFSPFSMVGLVDSCTLGPGGHVFVLLGACDFGWVGDTLSCVM